MVDARIKRDNSTRETEVRKKAWTPPEVLPSPNLEEGYQFRWIRVSSLGQIDATNLTSKIREGWTPAKSKDHPEISLVAIEHERFKDNIVIGGLMLCKIPNELIESRKAYYEKQAESQMQSVDNNLMRESDARMPLFNERQTKVSFGKGT